MINMWKIYFERQWTLALKNKPMRRRVRFYILNTFKGHVNINMSTFWRQIYWKCGWDIMWERLHRPIDTRQIPLSRLNQSYLPGPYIFFRTMYTVAVTLSEPDEPTWAHMPGPQEKTRQLLLSAHQWLHDPSRLATVDGACCCRNGRGSTLCSERSMKSQERTRSYQLHQAIRPTSAEKADELFVIIAAQHNLIHILSKKTHHG